MLNVFCRRPVLLLLLFALVASTAATRTQAQTVTTLGRQLSRVDVALSGFGQFRSNVTGTNYQDVSITQGATNSFGGLFTIRYTKSPLLGAEFNYSFVRYTETFFSNSTTSNPNPIQYLPGGAQTNTSEYTVGYVAHAPEILGIHAFGDAGLGSTAFSPTTFAGQGLPRQARATYYYGVGAEAPVIGHFGLRAQFRELFFLAPDFGQNYLTIKQHTTSIRPSVGIYLHF